jgi:hypothetical protein
LNLKCGKLHSNSAFKFNLHRYNQELNVDVVAATTPLLVEYEAGFYPHPFFGST